MSITEIEGFRPSFSNLKKIGRPMPLSAISSGIDSSALNALIFKDLAARRTESAERSETGNPQTILQDELIISPESRKRYNAQVGKNFEANQSGEEGEKSQESTLEDKKSASGKPKSEELNDEEQRKLDKMQQRDREVRTHEQAHIAAAGGLARGGARYQYQRGPDGKQYAVGGEVGLAIPDSPNPQQDLQNARKVERAALAPAKPSSQDLKVAAQARRKASQAQREISQNNSNGAKKAGLKTEAENLQEQTDAAAPEEMTNSTPLGIAERFKAKETEEKRESESPWQIENEKDSENNLIQSINAAAKPDSSDEAESSDIAPSVEVDSGNYRLDTNNPFKIDYRI